MPGHGFRGFRGWGWPRRAPGGGAKSPVPDSAMLAAILSDSFPSALSASSVIISTPWKRLRVEARPGPARFCVRLRGLRAPSVEPPKRKGTQSPGSARQVTDFTDFTDTIEAKWRGEQPIRLIRQSPRRAWRRWQRGLGLWSFLGTCDALGRGSGRCRNRPLLGLRGHGGRSKWCATQNRVQAVADDSVWVQRSVLVIVAWGCRLDCRCQLDGG